MIERAFSSASFELNDELRFFWKVSIDEIPDCIPDPRVACIKIEVRNRGLVIAIRVSDCRLRGEDIRFQQFLRNELGNREVLVDVAMVADILYSRRRTRPSTIAAFQR